MTDLLTLTWASDNEADQDTFNLLDFAQGFTLPDGGWIPQTMSDGQITCTETITFYMQGASHDSIAGFIQVLDDWKRKVAWSNDQTQRRAVWLNARWKTETNTRRAVVWSLNYSLGSSPFSPYLRESNFMPTFTIVIERGWWEELTILQAEGYRLTSLGSNKQLVDIGLVNLTMSGDVGARIVEMKISKYTPLITDQRYFWIGFRSSYLGTLANFIPKWELEDSSYLLATSSDTTVVADATASGGDKITTTFAAGASLTTRARINATDAAGGAYEDQRGQYACLLRAKMSDASVARVRAKSGFFSLSVSSQYVVNPRVPISGTSWFLYDLGQIRPPAADDKMASPTIPPMAWAGIELDAERVSGSGNLEMDCLILIPTNDSFMRLDYGTQENTVYIRTNPFGSIVSSGADFLVANTDTINWSIPANNESPLIIFSSQRNASNDMADEFIILFKIVRRWRTLRGTE